MLTSSTFRLVFAFVVVYTVYGATLLNYEEDFAASKGVSKEDDKPYWLCYVGHPVNGSKVGRIDPKKCDTDSAHQIQWVGYICGIIAILFFGSNFVPVKKYDTGDGVFFQWLLCVGIWLVGLVSYLALGAPPFFIPSIIGGALWCTGNLAVVPIIKMIGMTMGLTVWGVTNMLTGWVIGTFILKQSMTCKEVSYGGIALVIISVVILAFVKSEGKQSTESIQYAAETQALLGEKTDSLGGSLRDRMVKSREQSSPPSSINSSNSRVTFSPSPAPNGAAVASVQTADDSWVDKLSTWQKRIIGFGLSLVIGIFFAFIMVPVQYLKLCTDDYHSCSDMDYIFGVYCGILLASTFYTVVYAALQRNRPKLYPKTVIPGIISGVMWGIAMLCWFVANGNLSLAVSFPLVTAGPGFVSSAWGIIVYREIKGWKNITLYVVAFSISLCGLVINGLAKSTIHCHHHSSSNNNGTAAEW